MKFVLCVSFADRIRIGERVQVSKQVEPRWEVFGLPRRVCKMSLKRVNATETNCCTFTKTTEKMQTHLPFVLWNDCIWMRSKIMNGNYPQVILSTHKHRFQLSLNELVFQSFSYVLLIWPRSYLSLLASKGSDWLQMSSPLPERRAVEWSGPNLRRRRRFRLINKGLLTCQSMIQQINHRTLSHTADVVGSCVTDTQTVIIKTFIMAKSHLTLLGVY